MYLKESRVKLFNYKLFSAYPSRTRLNVRFVLHLFASAGLALPLRALDAVPSCCSLCFFFVILAWFTHTIPQAPISHQPARRNSIIFNFTVACITIIIFIRGAVLAQTKEVWKIHRGAHQYSRIGRHVEKWKNVYCTLDAYTC